MTPSLAVDIIRQALWTTFWLALPMLCLGLVVGVLVSLIQVVTSIQDSSFASSGVFVGDFLGSAGMLTEELVKFPAGGSEGPLLLL
jgi:flagellar biosynthetic protein FliQ